MTVSTTTRKVTYVGDGSTTSLPAPFVFFATTDLVVTSRVIATGVETTLAETTHYTVTGGSGSTGTVTVVDPATDFPATVEWTIARVLPRTQLVDYVEQDAFPAASHEQALDRGTMIDQEIDERVDRALRVPISESVSGQLPSSVDRANKFLAFDASGDPIASSGGPPATVVVSTFMESVLSAANAGAAADAMLLGLLTASGDILFNNAGDIQRLAAGSGQSVLSRNPFSSGAHLAYLFPRLPDGYLSGFELTRTSATRLTISRGEARSAFAGLLAYDFRDPLFSTTLDINAVANGNSLGSNIDGFPSGITLTANTWYHVFLILDTGTGDTSAGYDTSLTAANLRANHTGSGGADLSSFTRWRRIGSVKTDGSSNIIDFVQRGDRFWWVDPPLSLSLTAISSVSRDTITLNAGTGGDVPLGIEVDVSVNISFTADDFYLSELFVSDEAPSNSAAPLATMGVSGGEMKTWIRCNASQQVGVRSSGGGALGIATLGWIDRRGRDAFV